MMGRSPLPLALVLLLASACGAPERVETRVELTLLGQLDPSAKALVFTFTASGSGAMSNERREVVAPETRKIVFEHVIVDNGLTIAVDVVVGAAAVQHGLVGGKTVEGKVAAWTVTLAPITAPARVCDGLDNNADGQIDEAFCSG